MSPKKPIDSAGLENNCLGCGASLVAWLVKDGRAIERCPECGLIWVPEGVVTTNDGQTIYEGDDPIFMKDGNAAYYLDPSHLLNFERKLEWVRKFAPAQGTLLDAGANFGHFLHLAGAHYDARGFDIGTFPVSWSVENFGVRNQVASIFDLPKDLRGPFDIVTCFDVVEHVATPFDALRSIADTLRPGGWMFLTTPDAGSRCARTLGRYWHYLDPVQHVVLFSRPTLSEALRKQGLEVVDTRSIGHIYTLGYVFDRLAHLHSGRAIRRPLKAIATAAPNVVRNRTVYVNLGDVMAIAARKVE